MQRNEDVSAQTARRFVVVMTVLVFAFLVVAGRLYLLQVVEHTSYKERSEQNAMRRVPLKAVRGRILDRHGNIIVGNRPAYTLGVIPAEVEDAGRIDSMLSPVAGLDRGEIEERIGGWRRRWRRPVRINRDTPFRTIAYLEEHRHLFPSVVYMVESRRRYPHGNIAAHVAGYVRSISENQLEQLANRGYSLGDLKGQSGIEAQYEEYLRGEKGEEYQEVTASGQVLESHREDPVRGSDVRLTLDLELQKEAEQYMDAVPKGALVMMDPRNGEILAMVSRPTFDPDVFSFVVPQEVWHRLNDDELRPLFNRAIQGTYPPGSTAKMVTAIAALENGIIDQTTLLRPCRGTMRYGDRTFACWAGWGHGQLNVVDAIKVSCNIFFYQLGEMVGLDTWGASAEKCGLGRLTGVDLPSEKDGIVASTEVYDRLYGRYRWGQGEALNVGIGQGITVVTPIQMVSYVAALGTARLVSPHLAQAFIDPGGRIREVKVAPPESLEVDGKILSLLRTAMVLVTEGEGGTARRAIVPDLHCAGKTGTAQNPHGEDHSWFVGYAPAEDPQVAIAVVCENAGHGSDVAAPIAGRLLRSWLLDDPRMPWEIALAAMSDSARAAYFERLRKEREQRAAVDSLQQEESAVDTTGEGAGGGDAGSEAGAGERE